MKNTKDLKVPKLRALVTGLTKHGKTTFASTWPKPVYIDIDRGMAALRGKDIDYEDFADIDPPKVYDAVLKFLDSVKVDPKYETIVLDTFNRLEYYLNLTIKPSGTKFEFGEWFIKAQKNNELLLKLMNINLVYDKNVLVLVHATIDKDENTGRMALMPALQGSVQKSIGGYFDEIYHIEKVVKGAKREFLLSLENRDMIQAGSRFMEFTGELVIPAHYNEIIKRAKKVE